MNLSSLLPEALFGRKLHPNTERRLRLAQARAEETLLRAHVDNALMFVDALAEDLSFDRAIDTYIRVMNVPEPLASAIATRALVTLGRDVMPVRRRSKEEDERATPHTGLSGAVTQMGSAGPATPGVPSHQTERVGATEVPVTTPKIRLDEAANRSRSPQT